MSSTLRFIAPSLAALLTLSACGSDTKKEASASSDPALTDALGDQIMVDPDLTGQDRSTSGMAANGPAAGTQPNADRSPEAVAAAKAEAAKLAGGSVLAAPDAVSSSDAGAAPVTSAQLATAALGKGSNCADKVEYSAGWAARLPAALGVYPRGAVQEAAGTDKDGCALRVVSFHTPVTPKDVVDFYYTRARAAGYEAEHKMEGEDHVLGGSKNAAAYVIYVRAQKDGLTEVDVIANGG